MEEDSYERRALFLMMWHGAPSYKTRKMFPKWSAARYAMKTGSVDETLWLLNFSKEALNMQIVSNAISDIESVDQ